MSEAWTEAIKEAFAIAPTNVVAYDTLEFRQLGVQDPIFMVRARKSLTAFDEFGVERTFEPVGFQFSLPASNEEGFRSLNIAVDNIDRRVADFVALAKDSDVPIQVIYRPYLSNDLSAPQMDPPLILFLKDAQLNKYQALGRATFMDIINKKFPSELYTRDRFPSLG